MRAVFISAIAALATLASSRAGLSQPSPTADAEAIAFFEKSIRPLLAQKCTRCHSAAEGKLDGGLDLDRRGWEKGGFSGPAVAPGDPDGSLLIRSVRGEFPAAVMPPEERLDAAEIARLERWVAMGAPAPRAADPARHAPPGDHWAFRPVADVEPPPVEAAAWARNEVDRFVLARLEAGGLAPAPEADRRTLLRRLSFDLLGLPPSPGEIARFERDESPDAYERLVDRLLASPHYGERWAQHWLDVAGYADSNGDTMAMSHAWEYRDWVVRALNRDLPYDRFVTLQLAGDLLPEAPSEEAAVTDPERFDPWIATAFLVLGYLDVGEVDEEQQQLDVVDGQIDVVSKAFLALSVACARCHDHKFEPISTRDYYALAGIFRSTRTTDERAGTMRLWHERQIATVAAIAEREAWQRRASELEGEMQALAREGGERLRSRWSGRLGEYLLAGQAALDETIFLEGEDFARGNLLVDAEQWGTPDMVVVRSGFPGPQYAEYEISVPRATTLRLDARFAAVRPRPVRLLLNGRPVREDALGGTTATWDASSQAWFEVAELPLRAGLNVLRLERPEPGVPHLDKLLLAPPDLFSDRAPQGLVPGVVRNWASLLDGARRREQPLFSLWRELVGADPGSAATRVEAALAPLAARLSSTGTVAPAAEGAGRATSPLESELLARLQEPNGPFTLHPDQVEPFLPAAQRALLADRRAELEGHRAREPVLRRTLAAAEGTVVDLPVHRRGSHLSLAPHPTPRGVPALFDSFVPSPAMPADASGRLELARWLTHPEHPLTARVIVNRVWQGHFGRGLVGSPSDFGLRGQSPTHPELLDWLARRFVRDGWSLKALHRRIVLSSTYRMRSTGDATAAGVDPENRLLWRQNRRRLEAEALRDALLAVSGRLDLSIGGSLLDFPDGKELTKGILDELGRSSSTRRSLYLPVIRSDPYDFLATFDMPGQGTSVGRRQSTTTVQQALALMNDPLVIDSSEALARRILDDDATGADPGRVDRLYAQALGRPPSEGERLRALTFLEEIATRMEQPPVDVASNSASPAPAPADRGSSRLRAWRGLVQVLLSSNEFLYVD